MLCFNLNFHHHGYLGKDRLLAIEAHLITFAPFRDVVELRLVTSIALLRVFCYHHDYFCDGGLLPELLVLRCHFDLGILSQIEQFIL
jgi:hypothetical protein